MKQFLLVATLLAFHVDVVQAQIQNGSFENGANADLSNWQWTCGAQSQNFTPSGPGWCIQVSAGNTQGCFPGYAYQKLPSIVSGQNAILTGWCYRQGSPYVGIYFGKINNGNITLQAGDTTNAANWTQLSIQSSFSLGIGDTAVVVLFGGLTGGPMQGYGFFDLINLQLITGIADHGNASQISISPNPANDVIHVSSVESFCEVDITDITGRVVFTRSFSDESFYIDCAEFPEGIYFVSVISNEDYQTKKILIAH